MARRELKPNWNRKHLDNQNEMYKELYDGFYDASKQVSSMNVDIYEIQQIANEAKDLNRLSFESIDDVKKKSVDNENEIKKIDNKSEVLQNQLNNLVLESGQSDVEVVQARGDEKLLNDRLTKQENKINFSFKDNIPKGQCLVAGHRGMMNLAPENSKISFESAGKYGLKAIETDCHETTDGKFYLYHDADLSSQTNSSGKIYEKTSSQLADVVYIKAAGSENYPNTKLATLEEYLQVASKYDMFCLLETGVIRNFDNFLKVIYKSGMQGNVIIFGNQYNIAAVRKLDKNIMTGLVTWKVITKADVDFCVSNNIDMLGIAISDSGVSVNMNSEIIEYAHSKNIIIDAYVVNTTAELNWCKNNHIDIITTDVFVEV